MKKYLFLLLFSINFYAQSKELFEIEYIYLDKSPGEGELINTFPLNNRYFFEDENYVVSKTCNGEFGGNIVFKSKVDTSEYICKATCPVIINKINNKYYLTTSLSHMSGGCGLFEIENPTELSKLSKDDDDNNSFNKSISLVGLKTLFNISGKTILVSFTYQNKLYHIVNEGQKIYVAERENSELKSIQNIKSLGYLYPGTTAFRFTDVEWAATFRTKEVTGWLDIIENKIRIYTYK